MYSSNGIDFNNISTDIELEPVYEGDNVTESSTSKK